MYIYQILEYKNLNLIEMYEFLKGHILFILISKPSLVLVTTSRYNSMTRAWRLCLEGVTFHALLMVDSLVGSIIKSLCTSKRNILVI